MKEVFQVAKLQKDSEFIIDTCISLESFYTIVELVYRAGLNYMSDIKKKIWKIGGLIFKIVDLLLSIQLASFIVISRQG